MNKSKKYGAEYLGETSDFSGTTPKPKPGYSIWVEWGKVYTAPTVDAKRFGGHAYDNGGYENGVRECPCGCHMASSSSSGPVDPFGPCPENPLPVHKLPIQGALDYEIVETQDGDFQVWTPDENGGVIGSGSTKQAAVQNAIACMGATIARLAEPL